MAIFSRQFLVLTSAFNRHISYTHCKCRDYVLQSAKMKLAERLNVFHSKPTFYYRHISESLMFRNRAQVWNSSFRREIHTSSPRKALPPALVLLLRPLAKVAAVVFGRTARWWWKSLPQSRKDQFIQLLRRNRLLLLASLVPASAGGVYFYVIHLEEDSITKRVRFIAFTPGQMKQIADVAQQSVVGEFRDTILPPSHPSYVRVSRVANRLIKANLDLPHIKHHEWRIVIVDQPHVKNSLVLPNGSIFVFTGMLSVCSNDDQLGIILSHEISHALLHHMAEQMSSTHLIELMLFIPLLIVWAIVPSLAALIIHYLSDSFTELMIHLPFSRSNEMEADKLGLILAAKACFDVREASAFWNKMRILSDESSDENLEWLSTHPSFETRQQFLEGLMPSAIEIRECLECPKLPVIDPRLLVESLQKSSGNDKLRDNGVLVLKK